MHAELQKRNITQIVLGGIATSIGVEGTARQANEFGYNIAFASDAMSDMFADDSVSVNEMLAEAERELAMRLVVYPRRIAMGKMSQRKADRAIKVQQAIIALLTEVRKE